MKSITKATQEGELESAWMYCMRRDFDKQSAMI
jgi:hypothetical protein